MEHRRWTLADSLWPRSGGDVRNSACVDVPLPRTVDAQVVLPLPTGEARHSGIAVAADGSLRVAHRGHLLLTDSSGVVAASHKIGNHSLPLVLDTGETLILSDSEFLVCGAVTGEIMQRISLPDVGDDSGPSPCITNRGQLIATSPAGDVHVLSESGWELLGTFGYDIVPPALFSDGSLAVSGYYGTGFCRLDLDGSIRWRGLHQADMVPCVSKSDCVAVGSLNEGASEIYAADGAVLGRYPRAAIFTVHPKGWVALSDGELALLSPVGEELWRQRISVERDWGTRQCVVDRTGFVYAPNSQGIRCFDPEGRLVFETILPEATPGSIAAVDEDRIGFTHGDDLILLG